MGLDTPRSPKTSTSPPTKESVSPSGTVSGSLRAIVIGAGLAEVNPKAAGAAVLSSGSGAASAVTKSGPDSNRSTSALLA